MGYLFCPSNGWCRRYIFGLSVRLCVRLTCIDACSRERFLRSACRRLLVFIIFFYPRDAMLARVLAMALCLCLSQVRVLSKRLNESGWFLAWDRLSTCPTLSYKEMQVLSKIRVLSSGTLLQTMDLEHFATAYRSSKRVINLARARRVSNNTYSTIYPNSTHKNSIT